MQRFIFFLIVIGLAGYAYTKYEDNSRIRRALEAEFESSKPMPSARVPKADTSLAAYKCDGRVHCSQMTSCAEAKFFLKNCPGTKMDGDNDGIPCESQWCK
jgi:hypothetical protein